jgi:hypothetical protein
MEQHVKVLTNPVSYFVAWEIILLIELACSFAASTNESCSSDKVALRYPDK